MEPKATRDEVSHSKSLVESFIAQEVRRHPEQLATTLMNAPNVGVAICDHQLRFRSINDALAAMNGLPAKVHLGQSIHDILGDVAAKLEPLFRHVFARGNSVLNVHVTGILPTRKEPGHWIENYFPLKDAQGRVNRLCAMVIEVTEQKKLEESLRLLATLGKESKDQLEVLAQFHSRLVSKPDFGELTRAITAYVNRVIPHDYAMLALEDETAQLLGMDLKEDAALRLVNAHGALAPMVGRLELANAARTNRDCRQESILHAGPWNQMLGPGVESVYDMSLVVAGRVIGTLHLASRQRDAFNGLNREQAENVAMHIALALDYARARKENESLKRKLGDQKICVETDRGQKEKFSDLVGASAALKKVFAQARTLAESDAPVLILGETGTGKELIAGTIHGMSGRKEQNFIKVNCTAVPTGLLETELFGQEKGEFAGAAVEKMGRLELADAGTLLLNEIGDLPLELQAKLLRVLQDGKFERRGGTRTKQVNVRLMVATNQDLAKKVAEGRFRADLFYRLNMFSLRMPALRERREDIPQLVRHFVQKFSRHMDKHIETIPNTLMEELQRSDWPGNVRELEQFVERSVIMTPGTVMRGSLPELPEPDSGSVECTLEAMERDYILQVLRGTQGKVGGINGAASKLGMKRTTLQSRMLKLKIRNRLRREIETRSDKS